METINPSDLVQTRAFHTGSIFPAILELSSDGFAVFDAGDLKLIECNPAFSDLLSIPKTSRLSLGKLLPELNPRSDAAQSFERVVLVPNGAIYLEVSASAVRTEGSRYWFVQARDVSDRKQQEHVLQNQLNHALLLDRIIQAAAAYLDPQRMLEMICRELGQALNVPRACVGLADKANQAAKVVAEYYTQDLSALAGSPTGIAALLIAQSVLETSIPLSIDDVREDPTVEALRGVLQQQGTLSLLAVPLMIHKRAVGVLALSVDEPRQFTREEISLAQDVGLAAGRALEVARLYEKLQRELKQREEHLQRLQTYTDEIDHKNRELSGARDKALEVSRMVSEFLAFMSHEIRTPLTSIVGMTDLLLDAGLNAEQQDFAGVVRDSAQILLTLVNDVLDYSKIEAGRLELEEIRFEPLQLVEMSAEMFTARAREKNITLMAFVAPEIPACLTGDPVRLRQVLTNLISNAVKFTESGEVSVRATMEKRDEDHAILRFEVQDTGIGMSDEVRERLFQPFSQGGESIARRYGGTGLGLAISKRLVELMGGQIGVETAPEKGSAFWFTARLGCIETAGEQVLNQTRTRLEGTRVLIIEDNIHHRRILHNYIDSWGMFCDEAETAGEAFMMLEKSARERNPYSVVLVDMKLPDGSGYEVKEWIDQQGTLPDAYLIMMTAFDRHGQAQEVLKRGFSAYLSKPIRQSLLYDSIANVVLSDPELANCAVEAVPGPGNSGTTVLNESIKSQPVRSNEKKIVLLVEDNAANRRLGRIQLEKLGYQVETMESGSQAVEAVKLSPKRYAMVLMDCQMPDMDGMTATRAIRSTERQFGRHLPIIAMTANAMRGDREACLDAGMDDYISKPVSMWDLEKVTERWTKAPVNNDPFMPVASPELDLWVAEPEPIGHALDPQMLKEIRDLQMEDQPDFLTELIDMWLVDSQNFMNMIRHLLANHNLVDMCRPVHSLKGTSANLGAVFLPGLCSEMEALIEKGDIVGVEAYLPKLDAEYQRVRAAMMRERRPAN